MGGVWPETCWVLYKYEIKFWYTVASCWISYVNYIKMYGSTNNIFNRLRSKLINVCFLWFVIAFLKSRKATVSFLMFVCPSACLPVGPHGTTRLPLDRFLRNLTSKYFSKIFRQNSSFIKIWQEQMILYMKTNIHFWSYPAKFHCNSTDLQKVVSKSVHYV